MREMINPVPTIKVHKSGKNFGYKVVKPMESKRHHSEISSRPNLQLATQEKGHFNARTNVGTGLTFATS
jgi:hypothetical protein